MVVVVRGSSYISSRPLETEKGKMETASSPLVPSILVRTAMRVSRTRWFGFLKTVFHYQNGLRSASTPNPFDTGFWISLEFLAWATQMVIIMATLAVSRNENPIRPIRVWIAGYSLGLLLRLPILCRRFRNLYVGQRLTDVEEQRTNEHSSSDLMSKARTFLDLFFATWFVMGNVWVFDSRFGSVDRAPRLCMLCISLLAWNAVVYSFPFLLFVLHCCCVPFVSSTLGYNMNLGSVDRGASDDQISRLPYWRFEAADSKTQYSNGNTREECCICLAKYMEQEEVRQLPCSHLFHLKCVDQWLKSISCCPLCKHELDR